jgi:hypothetical protein
VNGWDLFTWAMVVVLALGSLLVFVLFVADARSLLKHLSKERT